MYGRKERVGTDSNTFAYKVLLVTTVSCKALSKKAPKPATNMSKNEPPKDKGQIVADSQKAMKHLVQSP